MYLLPIYSVKGDLYYIYGISKKAVSIETTFSFFLVREAGLVCIFAFGENKSIAASSHSEQRSSALHLVFQVPFLQ